MKNKSFILFILIFISNICFAANVMTEANKLAGGMDNFEDTLKKNRIILNDKSLNVDQKINTLIINLENIKSQIKLDKYIALIQDVESVMLQKATDVQTAYSHYTFLMGTFNLSFGDTNFSFKNTWPFKTANKKEIFQMMSDYTNFYACPSGCKKLHEYPLVKVIHGIPTIGMLMEEGKTYEALKLHKEISDIANNLSDEPGLLVEIFGTDYDKNQWPTMKKAFQGLVKLMGYRLAQVTKQTDKVLDQQEFMEDNFINDFNIWLVSAGLFPALSTSRARYEMDMSLGNYKNVIRKAFFLLQKISVDQTNFDLLRVKSSILKDISEAYSKLAFHDLSKIYHQQATNLDLKTGHIDTGVFGLEFENALIAKDLDKANNLVENMDKNCPKAKKENYLICRVFVQNYRKEIKKLKTAKNDDEYQEFIRQIWSERANYLLLEEMGPIDIPKNHIQSFTLLELYQIVYFGYSYAEEWQLAAFYGKKYINTLQNIRRNLSNRHTKQLKEFTTARADKIKDIIRIFYKIADYNAAMTAHKIIKENEFLDFVRRRGIEDDFLSTIDMTDSEKDFEIEVGVILSEIKALKLSLTDESEKKLYEESLAAKYSELSKIQSKYKKIAHASRSQFNKLKSNKFTSLVKANEAHLYYGVEEERLLIYVYLQNETKNFEIKINRTELAQNIFNLHQEASDPKKFPSESNVKFLSYILFEEAINYLNNKNISTLKIHTDEFISLLPFSLLTFNDKYVIDKYIIEKIGQGTNQKKLKQKLTLDAYGATEGNETFSKLPGVKKEIEAIVKLSSNQEIKRRAFLNEDFNRNNFFESFNTKTNLVHISTHFKIKGNIANNSQMLLGDGETISIEDLWSNLPNANTNLIVLSACNTGDLMSAKSGKASEGLSNIFQKRGAKYVLSTLWEIDDKFTSKFMTVFYSLLLNNEISSSAALNFTQNIFYKGSFKGIPKNIKLGDGIFIKDAILEIDKYKNPYYWAAFQISSVN